MRTWVMRAGCIAYLKTSTAIGRVLTCSQRRPNESAARSCSASKAIVGWLRLSAADAIIRPVTKLDFSKLQGLVPAVVQDADTRDVLMVGFMNEEAWQVTQRTGYVTFFSRTRNALWTKGETSGNRLQVVRLQVDCDDDTVLVEARCLGDGVVCHTGERTCFFREVPRS